MRLLVGPATLVAVLVAAPGALAQAPPTAVEPPSPVVADARVVAADEVAPGGRVVVRTKGMPRPIRIQQRRDGEWVNRGEPITEIGEATVFRAPEAPGELRLRAETADGRISRSAFIDVRPLRLAAVGDINLGDGPGAMIARHGANYPWASVGPRLRRADIAVGNLECAVSLRGSPVPKTFTFRGRPSSLRAAARRGGLDVLSLANNHSGDYGRAALLDTLRATRRYGMTPVGAGATEAAAYRPQIVEALGLEVAFVAFGNILPFDFRAIGDRPGSAWAFPDRVRASIRRARREADVVIASFHWGIEKDRRESAQQRSLARLAIDAGATAVLGHHPHVLQPIRRPWKGRLVAYSLGNFVFSAVSPGTSSTGILELDLARGRVVRDRFRRARIVASRPLLR